MAKKQEHYALPDYSTTTTDIDEYIAAWQAMAKPIEDAMGLHLIGYDPEFLFAEMNPQRPGIKTVSMPVWFAKRLGEALSK